MRKQKYLASVKGRVHSDGRNVVIPVSLDNDPTRPVDVRIPRSKVVAILRAAVTAAERIDPLEA